MVTRRRFLNETALLILIPVTTACTNDDMNDEGSCDGAGATSSVDAGHSHFVCVDASDLASPPAGGARYTTSNVDGHTHEIEVSAEQLGTIGGGGTVMVNATVVMQHSHTFLLSNAQAWLHRTSKLGLRQAPA